MTQKLISNLLLFSILCFVSNNSLLAINETIAYPSVAVILSCENKTAIDLPAFTTKNAASIKTWDFKGQINQRWSINKAVSGFIIGSEYSKQCLTVNPHDSSVVQQPFTGNKDQCWDIQSKNDTVRIFNQEAGLYITLPADKSKGTLKLQKYCNSNLQLWKIYDYQKTNFADVFYDSYLKILQRASQYNNNDERVVPKFTYQKSDNPGLVSLRNHFKLDSIAGDGNDVSQIINLLNWIHDLIPHDNYHGNPKIKNAESMISLCKKENRGLNCRGLAMALNECYLSLGFKSRYVTCLPKDSLGFDTDCHVINTVYSESLKKWLWIDPTHNAFVMDEKGSMLSIEEVRERIILNKPLSINSDANWNHINPTIADEYLNHYMAKNLYMMQCPVNSEFDTETDKPDKVVEYIKLVPLDYINQKADKEGNTFLTNSPILFWSKPE